MIRCPDHPMVLPFLPLYVSILGCIPGRHMRKFILFLILTVPLFATAQPQPAKPGAPQKFKLPATPKTVAWGYYDSAATPVLRIHSGDTVEFDTLLTNSPTGLEKAGVPADQVE